MDVQTLIDMAGGVGKLATRISVSHSTICDWKRAGHIPGNRASQISAALAIPVTELLPLVKAPAPRERAA